MSNDINMKDVVLTPVMVENIKLMQEDDNSQIKSILADIADIICILAVGPDDATDFDTIKDPQIQRAVSNMVYIRGLFKQFKNPGISNLDA